MAGTRDRPLTTKEETFCQKWVETGNATEAYQFAYDTSNMKITTVYPKASMMLAKDKIQRRVRELQAAHMAEIDVTASDIVRVAWEIARSEDASHGSRVSALALLAKRHHEFSDKHEISSDVRLQAMQAVANMDEATLRALAESLRSGT